MASSGSPLPREAEVERSLEELRREPITTHGSQDAILAPIYTLLMSAPCASDGALHWYCDKARAVLSEAASFLLRLHAYTNNPRVEVWKERLAGVLHGCCGCVQGYTDAKMSSRDTYLAAFSKPVLDTFFSTIDGWEIGIIIKAIKDADLSSDSKKTLSDVPTAVFFHMLTNIHSFESSEILSVLQDYPPAFISLGWSIEVPPGLLLLLFHERNETRIWAQQQIVGCLPIEDAKFVGAYEVVHRFVTATLASGSPNSSSKSNINYTSRGGLYGYFSMSPPALWSGLQSYLRVLPINLLKSGNPTARNFYRAVIGHLHDGGSHFSDVLRAFIFLLKKHGNLLWQGEAHDYPQVVFDSIKDNAAYLRLIQKAELTASQQPWFIEWFQAYLVSLGDMPMFIDVLKKVVGFACEELQHERFKDKRQVVMASILTTLHIVFQSAKAEDQSDTYSRVLDIHADVIVDVALSPKRNTPPWQTARIAAQRLLLVALSADGSRAEAIIFKISDVVQQATSKSEPKRKYDLHPLSFHTQVWKTMYKTIGGDDSEGIKLLISLVARSAYLDTISPDAFNPTNLPAETRANFSSIITSVNAGFCAMRHGFLDAVTQYTNSTSNTTQVVQSLVRAPGIVKHVIALMLSPVEELRISSQILLGQAYDVDVRSDCFRAILQDSPVASLDGLAMYIAAFNDCAPLFPEACSIAKSLVRCMTDVIEVLTNGHDGLLFDERFDQGSDNVRPQTRLPKLWALMCTAITIIFRRTPLWSKVYEPEVMVDWMRDALIFARDLVAQRRTFEAAAISNSQESKMTMISPRKLSQIGKQILNDLQPVLTESIRWLRLTDMELLHQSSTLVQTLMDTFRETGVRPSPDSLAKLERFLDSSRRKATPEDQRTKLSETHLSELATALSFFNQDDDDDIQIIGYKPPGGTESSLDAKPESFRPSAAVSSALVTRPLVTSSKNKPFVDIKSGNKSKLVPESQSLMNKVRRAAAQGLSSGSMTVRKAESLMRSSSRPIIKDESGSTKSGDSQVSSSEDEDSDEGDQGGLASLVKLQKSPLVKVKKPTGRRTVKMMEPKFTVQNAALDRIRKREEAHRAALRMKPDLRPLHRIILSWNYDHDGPEPPIHRERPTYMAVMDQFESDQDYRRVFEPLLTLECWNQLIKSKEEATPETFTCKINSRQFIDEWLDLDVSVTDRPPERWRLAETDIVLLRKVGGPNSVLAKVQSSRRMPYDIQATLRCRIDTNAGDPGLHTNTQWRLTKVFNLSTITREFAALKALPYYDFYPEIMKPRPARVPDLSTAQVQQAMKSYRVNEPQATAILGSLQIEGFSLIQGPPGTGKTWTICGIVGAFLSTRSRPATVVQTGRNAASSEKTPPLKILVCAPSNAAIDEVAKRVKDGVRTSDGQLVVPNVVRVGSEEAINISVKDISLDQLVDQRLNADPKQTNSTSSSAATEMAALRAEMDNLRTTRSLKMQEMTNLRDNVSRLQALEAELKLLNNKRMSLSQQLNRLKDQQNSDSRTLDAARRKYRAEVLMDADIICATLSGAGHEVLENLEFEMIVIDEAAQSIELSSLIPLKYRSKRCIMVGDPQQLPPTVLSPLANKFGYGQSLFVRLQKSRPEAVRLLSIQYRMHPDISRLPSKLFYAQRLLDGPGMAEKTSQIWHDHPLFGTYRFINVASGGEQKAISGHSLINGSECEIAVALYNRIKTEHIKIDFDFRIGVITMYRAQLLELKKKFRAAFGADIVGKIDFNTVDGFQGQEKDIIILSCVRAGPGVQSIGFLADHRRLNVAITRARSSLFILGHAATLERSDQVWKEIVQDARGTSRILNADASTYRRPLNVPMTPRAVVKVTSTSIEVPTTSDLKTPKDIVKSKSYSVAPTAGPSFAIAGPSDTHTDVQHQAKITRLNDANPGHTKKKRRDSDDGDVQHLPASLRTVSDTQSRPEEQRQRQPVPPTRKRPKEVSMFIPKKKPDGNLKRPAPDMDNPSQGDIKRRVTDRYYD